MLDAIPFTDDAYEGVGNSLLARTVGYGIKNSTLGAYDGNLWRRFSLNDVILSGDFIHQRITDTWIENNKSILGGLANNGLVYDKCQAGQTLHTNSRSPCYDKGMNIPEITKTTGNDVNGVPSCSTGWTWSLTQTHNDPYNYANDIFNIWQNSSVSTSGISNSRGVRCIR